MCSHLNSNLAALAKDPAPTCDAVFGVQPTQDVMVAMEAQIGKLEQDWQTAYNAASLLAKAGQNFQV